MSPTRRPVRPFSTISLGIKKSYPYEKNKGILVEVLKMHPGNIEAVIAVLRKVPWYGKERENLDKLRCFVEKVRITGRFEDVSEEEREIESLRRDPRPSRRKARSEFWKADSKFPRAS